MNPFSLPSTDLELYLLKERQRDIDRAITAEERLVPVHYRKSKNEYSMLQELKKTLTPKASTSYRSRRSQSYNRENIQELITKKREILMTKKKIEHKRNSISILDEITRCREDDQRKAAKEIEDSLIMFDKYEEKLKTEAKEKAELAGKKVKERLEKQIKIAKLEQEIEYMYGQFERKKEQFKTLCIYKEFVQELSSQTKKKSTSSVFVTSSNQGSNITPLSLLTSINSLEQTNLFLIQQAQEAEINLDNLKSKCTTDQDSLSTELENIKNNIKTMEKSKQLNILKHQNFLNEQGEDPLISPETMQKLHLGLVEIFGAIGGDIATFPTDFEILENLETAIRLEIEKTKLMDEELVRNKEKEVDKKRRVNNVEMLKMKETQKTKEVSEMIERRKKKIVKKNGRRKMDKSWIPEKVVLEEKVEIPQEVLDWKEFLEEDLPYK